MTDGYVQGLVNERGGYIRSCRADRVALVDSELARLGWCVDGEGELVRISELKPSDPAPEAAVPVDDAERAVSPAPRRGRPRKAV